MLQQKRKKLVLLKRGRLGIESRKFKKCGGHLLADGTPTCCLPVRRRTFLPANYNYLIPGLPTGIARAATIFIETL